MGSCLSHVPFCSFTTLQNRLLILLSGWGVCPACINHHHGAAGAGLLPRVCSPSAAWCLQHALSLSFSLLLHGLDCPQRRSVLYRGGFSSCRCNSCDHLECRMGEVTSSVEHLHPADTLTETHSVLRCLILD